MAQSWALPHLDGRRGRVVRAVYLVLAALTLCAIAGSTIFNGLDFFRNMPSAMQWGFRTFTADDHPRIGNVTPGAYAAGIRDKDKIVAIQGVRLAPAANEFDIGAKLDAVKGDSLSLVTRRLDGSVATHRLERLPDVWQRIDGLSGLPLWLYASCAFLNLQLIPASLLAASFLLYRRRSTDPEAMLFAIGFLLLTNLPDVDFWLTAKFGVPGAVMNLLVAAGWSAIFIAIAGFPDGRFESRWARGVALAIAPIVYISFLLSFTPLATSPITRAFSMTSVVLVALAAMVAVTKRYRALPPGPERQQIKWVVMGFCVTAIAAIIVTPLPPPQGQAAYYLFFLVVRLFVFASLPLGLLVSLLRYRLYDAEATISRSAAYAVLTVSLLAIFAASEKLIEILGEHYFASSAGAVAGGIAAGIAAVLITPMHHRVNHWAEQRFQKGLLRLRNGLPELVGDLRETASLDQIARAILSRIAEGVRARRLALIMGTTIVAIRDTDAGSVDAWRTRWTPGDGTALDCDRSDPGFPLRIPLAREGEAPFGWILLGPRPDGSFYGRDERDALAAIADPVARAITIVTQREATETVHMQTTTHLSARIEQLEEAVARLLRRRAPVPAAE